MPQRFMGVEVTASCIPDIRVRGKWLASCSSHFTCGERTTGIHWI